MAGQMSQNQIVGILLIIAGILLAFTGVAGVLVFVGAIAAVVIGILMLLKVMQGSTLLAVLAILIGVLLLSAKYIPGVSELIHIIALVGGILLIVLGILKLVGKA